MANKLIKTSRNEHKYKDFDIHHHLKSRLYVNPYNKPPNYRRCDKYFKEQNQDGRRNGYHSHRKRKMVIETQQENGEYC